MILNIDWYHYCMYLFKIFINLPIFIKKDLAPPFKKLHVLDNW